MKLPKFTIAVIALVVVFASSCGSDHKKTTDAHTASDGHNHNEVATDKEVSKKVNKYENELGQALDKNGQFITGCPSHKEMIGVEGDQCPKCGYMTMLPITWSLEGIDTVRVASLPDYHPIGNKAKK